MKIVKESINESFEELAHKALTQTKQDPEFSIYQYFDDRGTVDMLRALRSILKRILNGTDPREAYAESCDINGVVKPQDKKELEDTLYNVFDVDVNVPF